MTDEPESADLVPPRRSRSRFFYIPMLIIVAAMVCLIAIILIRTGWEAIVG
jgi:uncharacterized membrane protein